MIRKLQDSLDFDVSEKKALLITTLVFAFILSFDQWGGETLDVAVGLRNLLISIVIVSVSLLVHHMGHRLLARKMGYDTKFRYWGVGVAACLLFVLITNGDVKLFIGGSALYTHNALRRLSRSNYRESLTEYVYLGLAGPIASLLFAAVIRALALVLPFNTYLVNQLVYFNMIYAVLSLLPFPKLDGAKLLMYGRGIYVFFGSTIAAYVLVGFLGYYSVLIALLLGAATTLIYFFTFEGDGKKINI